jgi:hypothetical protein
MASFPSRWAARILCHPEQAEKPYGVTTADACRSEIRWRFTTAEARIKLHRLDPSLP